MEPTDFGYFQLLASFLPFLLVSAAIYAYFAACLMIIAQKTGTPGAMLAWIPIVNIYLMARIARRPGYWLILSLIPLLGLLFLLIMWTDIARMRGRPGWFGLLLIVPLLGLIVPAVLAGGAASASETARRRTEPAAAGPEYDSQPVAAGPPPSLTACPGCSADVSPDDLFCGECGFNLAEARASLESPGEAEWEGGVSTDFGGDASPPKKSGGGLVVAGVAAVALIGLLGIAVLGWMLLGGGGSSDGQAPQLPQRMAGSLTEFPVDTEAANPVRPGSVISQNFQGGKGDQSVSVPAGWLPPGLPPDSLPPQCESVTSTTYRNQATDPPVNVHVLQTSMPATNVAVNISVQIASSTGGQRTGVRVESPQGEIYEGTRIESGQQLVFVLAKQIANVVIIIFASDPSVHNVATRLAGNVGNGQGLIDYPEVRQSIFALPSAAPDDLELVEMRSFTPDDLGLAELENAGSDDDPMAEQIREVVQQIQALIPPRLVGIRYEDSAGQEWGVLLGDYQSAFKSWAAWLLLGTLLSVESQSVEVGSSSGRLLEQPEGPLLIFRSEGAIIGIQAPPGTATSSLVGLGSQF